MGTLESDALVVVVVVVVVAVAVAVVVALVVVVLTVCINEISVDNAKQVHLIPGVTSLWT